jgi:hypothetical protein
MLHPRVPTATRSFVPLRPLVLVNGGGVRRRHTRSLSVLGDPQNPREVADDSDRRNPRLAKRKIRDFVTTLRTTLDLASLNAGVYLGLR